MENIHFLTRNYSLIYYSKYFKIIQNKYVYFYEKNSYKLNLINKEDFNKIIIEFKKYKEIYNNNKLYYYYLFIKEIIISYLKKNFLNKLLEITKKTFIFYIIDNIGIKDIIKIKFLTY